MYPAGTFLQLIQYTNTEGQGGGGGGGGGGGVAYGFSRDRYRGVPRIFGGGGGGGLPRSAKEANKPNNRATELKPLTCAHQGSMFRPY